jgi:hypothetical protein
MTLNINPQVTTTAAGTFGVDWDGLMQGVAMPDPGTMWALAGGYVAPAETDPMFGGIAITEHVPLAIGSPPNSPATELGGPIGRATAVASGAAPITGFSVFDQNYAMINWPASPVPLASAYQQVNFYRLGSGARIVLAMDPALAATLYGSVVNSPSALVTWDFVNQRLIAIGGGTALPVKILRVKATNSMTVNFTTGAGAATWNRNGSAALCQI